MSLSHDQAKDGKAVFDDFACLHLPTVAREPSARSIGGVSPGPHPAWFGLTGRRVLAGDEGASRRHAAGPGIFLRP